MSGGLSEIRLYAIGQEINQLIRSLPPGATDYTVHYDHNEDFFIQLERPVTVPRFPIHHDVRVARPSGRYLAALAELLADLAGNVPQAFRGLRYYFDPGDILGPVFAEVLTFGERSYLYLMKLDLRFRPSDAEITEPGSNDETARYRSDKVFLEATLIPLEEVHGENGGGQMGYTVRQTISSTWIGETGRGYLVQGIWMDRELTKFFSKLFVPSGVRFYPYYPFVCRYRTLCHVVTHLAPEGRRRHVPVLHHAIDYVAPGMRDIEEALRSRDFSEELPVFRTMKSRLSSYFAEVFSSLHVTAYLNDRDMKEFLIEA